MNNFSDFLKEHLQVVQVSDKSILPDIDHEATDCMIAKIILKEKIFRDFEDIANTRV